MECKKCKGASTILLRKKDSYCDICFITNMNHKFRACIGKNKILTSNEKVLVCLSHGSGSAVMLDFIYNGIHLDNHKKLRIVPLFLHVIDEESDNNLSRAAEMIELCKSYNFDVYLPHISEYMQTNNKLPVTNGISMSNNQNEVQFYAMLKNIPATARNDYIHKIKRNLFIRFAKLLQCKFIFTAETTSTLAINLLSNIALGRGSQIENDIGFCDNTDENVKLLRPMKDISKEELDHYINLKQLFSLNYNDKQQTSLQSVIKTFVTDLQESFPATISTVCKTADKIGVHDDKSIQGKCVLCENDIGAKNHKLTALDAINFSRILSCSSPSDASNHLETSQQQDVNKVMFPYIHEELCYGCSRNYSEMKMCNLPNHKQKLLHRYQNE